jgi:Flp pilus assembly protein protease CpaA
MNFPPPYFPLPSPYFLLIVAIALSGLMGAAAWIDWKTWRIPKRLTVGMFVSGLAMQIVGGVWMGVEGKPGWLFDGGAALGVVDGLLFSLSGALTGFAIFFAFWILSVAGGGDVKHATALGAWVGPRLFLTVLLFSMFVVAVLTVATLLSGLAKGKPKGDAPANPAKPKHRRLMSFSLPLAVATLIVFLLIFRVPLGLSNS